MKPVEPKYLDLIQLLLAGKSQEEAARKLGVSVKTVQRWLALPAVRDAYREAREDIAGYVQHEIKKLAGKAIHALDESLESRAPMVKMHATEFTINRIAPLDLIAARSKTEQEGALMERDLLPYLTDDELTALERILAQGRKRKDEADEQKITPLRRPG